MHFFKMQRLPSQQTVQLSRVPRLRRSARPWFSARLRRCRAPIQLAAGTCFLCNTSASCGPREGSRSRLPPITLSLPASSRIRFSQADRDSGLYQTRRRASRRTFTSSPRSPRWSPRHQPCHKLLTENSPRKPLSHRRGQHTPPLPPRPMPPPRLTPPPRLVRRRLHLLQSSCTYKQHLLYHSCLLSPWHPHWQTLSSAEGGRTLPLCYVSFCVTGSHCCAARCSTFCSTRSGSCRAASTAGCQISRSGGGHVAGYGGCRAASSCCCRATHCGTASGRLTGLPCDYCLAV